MKPFGSMIWQEYITSQGVPKYVPCSYCCFKRALLILLWVEYIHMASTSVSSGFCGSGIYILISFSTFSPILLCFQNAIFGRTNCQQSWQVLFWLIKYYWLKQVLYRLFIQILSYIYLLSLLTDWMNLGFFRREIIIWVKS